MLAATACGGTGSGILGIASGGNTATQRTLVFTIQPAGANADEIITPAVQVAALDSAGATDVTFAGTVTLRLGGNPTGAFLGGTRTVGAVGGVASFGDITVDRPGSGFSLVATAPGARAATSAGFNIVERP
jgi:hypothetical protein